MSDSTAKVNILWELKKKKYQFICLKLFEQSLSTLTWPHILYQCLENKHLKWMILFFPPKLNFFFFLTNWSLVALQCSVSFSACVRAQWLQSCLTLCDLMDCSLPGSSCPWDSPGKNTGVGCPTFLQGIFLARGLSSCLLYWGSFFTAELPGTLLH